MGRQSNMFDGESVALMHVLVIIKIFIRTTLDII